MLWNPGCSNLERKVKEDYRSQVVELNLRYLPPADLAFKKVVPLQGTRSWSNQVNHTSNPKY